MVLEEMVAPVYSLVEAEVLEVKVEKVAPAVVREVQVDQVDRVDRPLLRDRVLQVVMAVSTDSPMKTIRTDRMRLTDQMHLLRLRHQRRVLNVIFHRNANRVILHVLLADRHLFHNRYLFHRRSVSDVRILLMIQTHPAQAAEAAEAAEEVAEIQMAQKIHLVSTNRWTPIIHMWTLTTPMVYATKFLADLVMHSL